MPEQETQYFNFKEIINFQGTFRHVYDYSFIGRSFLEWISFATSHTQENVKLKLKV